MPWHPFCLAPPPTCASCCCPPTCTAPIRFEACLCTPSPCAAFGSTIYSAAPAPLHLQSIDHTTSKQGRRRGCLDAVGGQRALPRPAQGPCAGPAAQKHTICQTHAPSQNKLTSGRAAQVRLRARDMRGTAACCRSSWRTVFALVSALTLGCCASRPGPSDSEPSDAAAATLLAPRPNTANCSKLFLEQPVDQSCYNRDCATWQQRYYLCDSFYNAFVPAAPILFYGECAAACAAGRLPWCCCCQRAAPAAVVLLLPSLGPCADRCMRVNHLAPSHATHPAAVGNEGAVPKAVNTSGLMWQMAAELGGLLVFGEVRCQGGVTTLATSAQAHEPHRHPSGTDTHLIDPAAGAAGALVRWQRGGSRPCSSSSSLPTFTSQAPPHLPPHPPVCHHAAPLLRRQPAGEQHRRGRSQLPLPVGGTGADGPNQADTGDIVHGASISKPVPAHTRLCRRWETRAEGTGLVAATGMPAMPPAPAQAAHCQHLPVLRVKVPLLPFLHQRLCCLHRRPWQQPPPPIIPPPPTGQHARTEHGSRDAPVAVFGASYGGMLAAWLRARYPQVPGRLGAGGWMEEG